MVLEIQNYLRELESIHGVEILYACESGSRAWGFASPDSDYDIRFIYREPIAKAYGIGRRPDTIECPLLGELDAGGWSVQKALTLLTKSNGALIEWLHSPTPYVVVEPFLQELRSLAQQHSPLKPLGNHYRGMVMQTLQSRLGKEAPTGKAYLYALRSLLAADWIAQKKTFPPVEFAKLLALVPAEILSAIESLVKWKATASEYASPERQPLLDVYINENLPRVSEAISKLAEPVLENSPYVALLHRWTKWPTQFPAPHLKISDLTISRVNQRDLLLFETVSGSRAFGTHHENSDTDLRGIFVAPPSFLLGLETIKQVGDARGDVVYYEIGRFIELLLVNNPNLLELLYSPACCIRFQHPAFSLVNPADFVSKICLTSFGNYAMGQIHKARGLNKKIMNPEPEQRRKLKDFCHVLAHQGTLNIDEWIRQSGRQETDFTLSAVAHAPGTYALYPASGSGGLFSKKEEAALLVGSIAKELDPIAWMHCNIDAYKAHTRAHGEYWEWMKLRNEERYATNAEHGGGYDSKNLMHTLRLLEQAIEIAREGRIILPRPNSEWLKRVKAGSYSYEDVVKIAEDRHLEMVAAFEASALPETPDRDKAARTLLEIRERFTA